MRSDIGPKVRQCGSYDLTRVPIQESGSITRVEEFGLSSVSEEVNISDTERPESTSPDTGKIPISGTRILSDRHLKLLRGNLRKKTASSDDILESNKNKTKLQRPPPVSFSMDKLCTDVENDETTATMTTMVVGTGTEVEITRDHGAKGGLIKRRMLGSIRGLMASTHLLQTYEIEEVISCTRVLLVLSRNRC